MKMLGEDPPGRPESPPTPALACTAEIRRARPVLPQLRPAGPVVVGSIIHRLKWAPRFKSTQNDFLIQPSSLYGNESEGDMMNLLD
ncbi:hypothetical protein EJB05_54404 [Eragrostis curvula]|uniref:Uncharacterized protein n=1 Tax=Eragrostis curvula TaxID=38414 RepID=A0A5J9SMK0_9POAL|nr:hypothetical protein EJB05_54404 [Eragrostis curvula]